eukprot:TRINITY_DN11746_c0_g1_i1.p1 TRINITY_DN11746_c0_g1~~TRINITY_DN11746_c0_g1_i1.p1  ORF type:complete len:386 (+),score=100.98 TRINITY_DN11746_c0_g1_i1:472-1629(+)
MSRPALLMFNDEVGSFRYVTLTQRQPGVVRKIIADCAPTEAQAAQLEALAKAIEGDGSGVIEALPDDAKFHGIREYWGGKWVDAPWLHGEAYIFCLLADIMNWVTDRRDYFLPSKEHSVEVCWDAIKTGCERAGSLSLGGLLANSLWGNKVDLCLFASSDKSRLEETSCESHNISNDMPAVLEHLAAAAEGAVHLVADNYGYELFNDLVLIDALCTKGYSCTLHVKNMPYFVSDARIDDVHRFIAQLQAEGPPTAAVGSSLAGHMSSGRLTLADHAFWTAPLEFTDMPEDLKAVLAAADLCIVKGDLNYRKLVGDRHWPKDTPFAETVGYFPCPVVALRTLKSEVCVGVTGDVQARLEKTHPWPKWAVCGDYGVAQFSKASRSSS